MSEVLLLAGSPRTASQSEHVLRALGDRISARGLETETLLVRDLPGDALLGADRTRSELSTAERSLAAAAGVVIASPVYQGSMSGLLKLWLDALPQIAFRGKVVLPIATGGSLSSTMALDHALRPVLTSMGCLHVLPGVFVLDDWISGSGLPEALGTDRPRLALPKRVNKLVDEVLDAFMAAVQRASL